MKQHTTQQTDAFYAMIHLKKNARVVRRYKTTAKSQVSLEEQHTPNAARR